MTRTELHAVISAILLTRDNPLASISMALPKASKDATTLLDCLLGETITPEPHRPTPMASTPVVAKRGPGRPRKHPTS